MIRRCLVLVLLVFAAAPLVAQEKPPAPERGRPPVDLVLIIDTSASMVGKGSKGRRTPVIFPAVRAAAKDLIAWTEPGDRVVLMAYDATVRADPTLAIQGEREKSHLVRRIDALEAKGIWTYTAAALRDAFAETQDLAAADSAAAGRPRAKVIILMTDGTNEPPPHDRDAAVDLAQVARNYSDQPWFVWQVQLGPDLDPMVSQALKDMPGYREARVDDSRTLSGFVREEIIADAEEVLRRATVTLRPDALALGTRTAGDTATAALTVVAEPPDVAGRIRLTADAPPDGAEIVITPGEVVLGSGPAQATVQVRLDPDSPAAGLTGFIVASVVDGPLDLAIGKLPWSVSVVPRSRALRVEPAELTFEPLRPGARAEVEVALIPEAGHQGGRVVLATGTLPDGVRAVVEPAELTLPPGGEGRAMVSIEIAEGAPAGPARGALELRVLEGALTLPAPALAWSTVVEPPPDPLRTALWIGAPSIALLAVLGAWWWTRRPRLHGRLRYWADGQNAATIELPGATRMPLFGAQRLAIGRPDGDVVLPGTGAQQAVVTAARRDGVIQCTITASSSSEMTHQDRRVTQLDLYDRDQFRFAGYEFEYRSDEIGMRPRTRS